MTRRELWALAARMAADDLTIGERLLLQPWERVWLTPRKAYAPSVVHQLLAALLVERRRHFEPKGPAH
jgi:hypothetical protein